MSENWKIRHQMRERSKKKGGSETGNSKTENNSCLRIWGEKGGKIIVGGGVRLTVDEVNGSKLKAKVSRGNFSRLKGEKGRRGLFKEGFRFRLKTGLHLIRGGMTCGTVLYQKKKHSEPGSKYRKPNQSRDTTLLRPQHPPTDIKNT